MPIRLSLLLLFAWCSFSAAHAQRDSLIKAIFPKGTVMHQNIPYAGDTEKKHLLDIYLPANATANTPLLVWVHGGGWMVNDKYADMSYMNSTIRAIINNGYALASIDYRFSSQAVFPAQVQDCNLALEYLYQHAADYKLDKRKIGLIGFSAGGHLASLMGLSHNNSIKDFYTDGRKPSFSIRCVVDFYGPSDLIALGINPPADTSLSNGRDALSLLLGALVVDRPDLAKRASPITYVDKQDPPFIIIQGEKDDGVPQSQSKVLHSWLKLSGVYSELIVVPGAPHFGVMFDAADIRERIIGFLGKYLK
jgi:acetyl esterase/lipase